MRTENNPKNPKKKKNKWRITIWLIDFLLFFLLLLVVLTPALISTKKGNQIILDQINKHVDGTTAYSSLSMSWRKGIRITDLKFRDGAGQILLLIKQLSTRPYYLSLLTQTPSFGATLIDEPQIEINLKTPQPKSISEKSTTAPLLPVKKIDLTIHNGSLKVTDTLGQTVNLSGINSKLDLKAPGQQTSFDVDMNLSSDDKKSQVTAAGQITPAKKTGWSPEGLSGSVKIECNDLDIETLGPIFAIAGIDFQAKGIASANLNTQFDDGRVESLAGSVKGRNIDITGDILKGDRLQTKTLDINAKLARQDNIINIENILVEADWLKAQITGRVPTNFESVNSVLNSSSEFAADFECQLGTVLSQMPNTFAVKKGTNVTSGLLKGSVNTSTAAGKRNITGQATLTGLAGIVDGKNIAISEPVTITTQISADKETIRFDKLDVSAAFAQINCSGTADVLQYTAQSDLSKLQAELGQFIDFGGYNIAGNISQQGSVTFDKDKINFVGSSEVKQFALASNKTRAYEPAADIKFDMQFRQKEGILAINYLNTDATVGKINIKDSVVALNKPGQNQSQINVFAKTVDLEKLRPFAVLFTNLPQEMTLSGIADSDISVTSKNDNYNFKTDNTKISKLKIGYPGQKPFEQDPVTLIADGWVNPNNKTYSINSVKWTSPQIKIDGDFAQETKGNSRSIKGKAKLEYDWSPAGPLASLFLPSELKIQGKRKDTINFSSTYPADKPDQLLPNLNADITTGFDKAEYAGLIMGKVETNIKAQNGLLNITPISTTLNNGKFNFAAQADLKGKPPLLKTPQPIKMIDGFEINDEIAKRYLPFFNPIFSNSVNVSGKANLSCDKFIVPIYAGKKEDIEITGTLSVDNLKLQTTESGLFGTLCSLMGKSAPGQNITVRPTKFEIKNGLVSYDDMQVDVGNNPVNFKGAIGLDKTLNMEVTLPYTIKGTTATVDKETAGRITLPITGTIDHPKLDTKKFLEIQTQKIIEDQLQELFKGKLKTKTDQQDKTELKGEDALKQILIDQIGRIIDQNAN